MPGSTSTFLSSMNTSNFLGAALVCCRRTGAPSFQSWASRPPLASICKLPPSTAGRGMQGTQPRFTASVWVKSLSIYAIDYTSLTIMYPGVKK